ncbi:hypothetical protein ACFFRR_011681 [Megaselia abdita]
MKMSPKHRSCYFETAEKSMVCSLMSLDERVKNETIVIDDCDDVEIVENLKKGLRIKEIFPCSVSTGCNENRKKYQPEHLLQCLLVKILKEFKNPNIHIENICSMLSKRYKFFYNIPPYDLVRMIKDTIKNKKFLKKFKIVLSEKNHCVLLPSEDEVISLDSEDEEDLGREIKMEYEATLSKDLVNYDVDTIIPEDYMILSKDHMNHDPDIEENASIIPEDDVMVPENEVAIIPEDYVKLNKDHMNHDPDIGENASIIPEDDVMVLENELVIDENISEEEHIEEEDLPLVIDESPTEDSSVDVVDSQHLSVVINLAVQKVVTQVIEENPHEIQQSCIPIDTEEILPIAIYKKGSKDTSLNKITENQELRKSLITIDNNKILQRITNKSSFYSSFPSKTNEEVSKIPVPRIGIHGVLSTLKELQLTTFSITDIVKYLDSQYEIGEKQSMYHKIYLTLKLNKDKYFERVDRTFWKLTISLNDILPRKASNSKKSKKGDNNLRKTQNQVLTTNKVVSKKSRNLEVMSDSHLNIYAQHQIIDGKQPLPKIGVSVILKSIHELQLSSFTINDIIQHFESNYEVNSKVKIYSKIYGTLMLHRGRYFKETVDRKWELIKPEI